MYLVRDIMYCHPGKARPMVDRFKALSKVVSKMGGPAMRITTDFSAERYWTVVAEMEVASIEQHLEMVRKSMDMPEAQEAMKGYHDLVAEGRREIYVIES
jgi:hypothetical protein